LATHCLLICSGCMSVTVILKMTACITLTTSVSAIYKQLGGTANEQLS